MDVQKVIRKTASLCPVCLRKVDAELVRYEGSKGIYLTKTCPDHGTFRVPVWKDLIDYADWLRSEHELSSSELAACTGSCDTCTSHTQGTCCVLLEVTKRCDLRCTYCFADGGCDKPDPSFDEICRQIDDITSQAGHPLLQFSGGEPTLRDDLPELIRYARRSGCRYTQINTNGIRLTDESFVKELSEAGLNIVFLQFDGTDDRIYKRLRGRELFGVKVRAIENCARYHIGVTLVPTIVKGINDTEIGSIYKFAVENSPAVKGVHFQPVTRLGRYPDDILKADRFTLDELVYEFCRQTGLNSNFIVPSKCDHAMCGIHGRLIVTPEKKVMPVESAIKQDRLLSNHSCISISSVKKRTSAEQNREFIGSHWSYREKPGPANECNCEAFSFDSFVRLLHNNTLTISAMAFQDAMNIDLERLYRCSLHVYDNGKLMPFCFEYLTPIEEPVKDPDYQ